MTRSIRPARERAPLRAALLSAAFIVTAAPGSAPLAEESLVAVTTDYETSGQCARMGLESPWTVETNLEPIGSDPVVRAWRNRIYVVNRLFADNIQVIDPEAGFETVLEFSVGAGSNPQDIAFADDDKAYVSRYESVWLYEVDPSTGSITDSIDLSVFADADGLPEMGRMALYGGRLFVQIQRIDRSTWTPLLPSYLAVVDVATNALIDVDPSAPGVQGIPLRASNPNGAMLLDEETGTIYVGETGSYLVLDGGIEKIAAVSLVSEGWVVTEATLGGDLGGFTLSGSRGYAVVSSDWFYTTRLVSFGVFTGSMTGTHYTTDGYVPDVEWDTATAHVFLADRKITQPGVHVFDAATGTKLTASPRNTGLPPADLVVYRTVQAGVDVAEGGEALLGGRFAWAEPNPARGGATLRFRVPNGATPEVLVYDVRGRLVRAIRSVRAPVADFLEVGWDGRDETGREVPPGVYFYRAAGTGDARGGRVVIVR